MKCKDEIAKMCMKAIKYKKYAKIRDCEECCIYCKNKCDHLCDKALEVEGCMMQEKQFIQGNWRKYMV